MESDKEFRYCRALYQVALTINSSLEAGQVLRAIVRSAAEAMEAKACALMLLTPDRRELRHAISHGLSDRYVRKGAISVDISMAEALQGRSVAIHDAGADPRVQYPEKAVDEGIASMLSVPARIRGEVVGVMRVYSAGLREFSPEDVEFMEAVAALGALALENARRYERVKGDFDAMTLYIYGGMGTVPVPAG